MGLSAVLWVIFAGPKVLQHMSGNTADLDTGNYHHLAWAILHGDGFASSILGRHHLGEHCSPVMVLVSLFYLVWPSAYVLMLLQATAAWAGVVLCLWQAGRELLKAELQSEGTRAIATGVVLVLMLLYPALLATWATQFQPITLGLPLVIAAVLLIEYGRTGWLWPVVILLLSTRESAPLAVVGLAIFAGVGKGRWGLAGVLVLVAATWAAVAMGVVMPYFRDGEWRHKSYIDWAADWDSKSLYLASVLLGFGPLIFLGRRAIAATLGALPGVVLNVSVDRPPQYEFLGHYDGQTAPFLMIGAVFGLGWLASRQWKTVWKSVSLAASLVVAGVLFGQVGVKGPFQLVGDYWPTRDARRAIAEAEAMAPHYADAPRFTAHHRLGPHLSGRPGYVAERMSRGESRWVSFATTRVVPGHIFFTLKDHDVIARSGMSEQLERSGHAKVIAQGDYIVVWQWPLDAPPLGSDALKRYAADGYREPSLDDHAANGL